ncbi:MAG: hypothetical protein JW794_08730 [Candidatus Cloacimonetes bacterium]|nr:hypothetical protein [Candidatus Cloacimonadota bacterium]
MIPSINKETRSFAMMKRDFDVALFIKIRAILLAGMVIPPIAWQNPYI